MASQASGLAVILLASAAGCGTTQSARYDTTAWDAICERAPIGVGHQYSQEEKAMMTEVGAWKLSVEHINRICHDRL